MSNKFKQLWKQKAIDTSYAGDVPTSLLAGQDLEGDEIVDEMSVEDGEIVHKPIEGMENDWTKNQVKKGMVDCPYCDGTGHDDSGQEDPDECQYCMGVGKVDSKDLKDYDKSQLTKSYQIVRNAPNEFIIIDDGGNQYGNTYVTMQDAKEDLKLANTNKSQLKKSLTSSMKDEIDSMYTHGDTKCSAGHQGAAERISQRLQGIPSFRSKIGNEFDFGHDVEDYLDDNCKFDKSQLKKGGSPMCVYLVIDEKGREVAVYGAKESAEQAIQSLGNKLGHKYKIIEKGQLDTTAEELDQEITNATNSSDFVENIKAIQLKRQKAIINQRNPDMSKSFKESWNILKADTNDAPYGDCPRCQGSGLISGAECSKCSGSGVLEKAQVNKTAQITEDKVMDMWSKGKSEVAIAKELNIRYDEVIKIIDSYAGQGGAKWDKSQIKKSNEDDAAEAAQDAGQRGMSAKEIASMVQSEYGISASKAAMMGSAYTEKSQVVECSHCHGSGVDEYNGRKIDCSYCDGTGKLEQSNGANAAVGPKGTGAMRFKSQVKKSFKDSWTGLNKSQDTENNKAEAKATAQNMLRNGKSLDKVEEFLHNDANLKADEINEILRKL